MGEEEVVTAAEWVYSLLQDTAVKPERVFQYTSPTGLLGMLRSDEVWSTHVSHLNDFSEFRYTLALLDEHLDEVLQAGGSKSSQVAVKEWKGALRKMPGIAMFVASFSEESDLLSQWRAYCPAAGGFSLGMHPLELMRSAKCPLIRCEYDVARQRTLVAQVTAKLIGDFNASLAAGRAEADARVHSGAAFVSCTFFLATAFKHPSFAEEREWRLVTRQLPDDAREICFREGRAGVVPYIRLPLGVRAKSIEEIVIGPTPHPEAALWATRAAAKHLLGRDVPVQVSKIPFRAW